MQRRLAVGQPLLPRQRGHLINQQESEKLRLNLSSKPTLLRLRHHQKLKLQHWRYLNGINLKRKLNLQKLKLNLEQAKTETKTYAHSGLERTLAARKLKLKLTLKTKTETKTRFRMLRKQRRRQPHEFVDAH